MRFGVLAPSDDGFIKGGGVESRERGLLSEPAHHQGKMMDMVITSCVYMVEGVGGGRHGPDLDDCNDSTRESARTATRSHTHTHTHTHNNRATSPIHDHTHRSPTRSPTGR